MDNKHYVVAWESSVSDAMGYRMELLSYEKCYDECQQLNQQMKNKWYFVLDYDLLSEEAWEEMKNEYSD